ncbi:hypothetical protein VNO78_21555 [Psophocarpus tetragonolobus]|uniref:Transport membrane protein n=1 Tax=Psophocarpus tetragonolobus TaxID=3891 RepID=A0AAN9SBY5_PSOTE
MNSYCLTKKEIAYSKKNHSIRLVSIIKREKPAPKGNPMVPMDASGGGSNSVSVGGESPAGTGSSRGPGWTSFDLGVLAEGWPNENEIGEEVTQSIPYLKAPSPGGPVEILMIPESSPVPTPPSPQDLLPSIEEGDKVASQVRKEKRPSLFIPEIPPYRGKDLEVQPPKSYNPLAVEEAENRIIHDFRALYQASFGETPPRREVRIRSVRILIGLGLTWFTRYWFPEELISPLVKPFLTLSLDSYFVCTQSTEASPTYVATSSIACSYFVFPLISHQIWCFLIPCCYGEQRRKYNRFLYLSGSRFSLFLFLTLPRVVPNVWYFLYFVGATSTNSLMIKLQPKIYDHIMLTVRISFIPSVCSQVLVIVICLPEPRGLSVETFTNNRRFLMVFPLLTAALSTPPDIWCQIVARFLISSIIELTIFVASIVQVREEAGRVE